MTDVAGVHERMPCRQYERHLRLAARRAAHNRAGQLTIKVGALPQRRKDRAAALVLAWAVERDVARDERPVLMETELYLASPGIVPERWGTVSGIHERHVCKGPLSPSCGGSQHT